MRKGAHFSGLRELARSAPHLSPNAGWMKDGVSGTISIVNDNNNFDMFIRSRYGDYSARKDGAMIIQTHS